MNRKRQNSQLHVLEWDDGEKASNSLHPKTSTELTAMANSQGLSLRSILEQSARSRKRETMDQLASHNLRNKCNRSRRACWCQTEGPKLGYTSKLLWVHAGLSLDTCVSG
mmetsp:Transcript_2259/g.15015  ORF Transcript_2259/g.15015 Transcript_2259/m.15015 type:complete len:110 (-) Transcript_2259:2503-2832(-)